MQIPPQINEPSPLDIIERERMRMGEALHEGLCQHLVAASLAIGRLMRWAENGKQPDKTDLAELGELVQRASSESRSLLQQLKSVPCEAEGLMKALDELATSAAKSIPCEFICEKLIFLRDSRQATGLYRICQEAVRNALKHSHACQITLSLTEKSGRISAEIRDNGRGFTAKGASSPPRGIELMHYLSNIIGANLTIDPNCNPGTSVICTILSERS